MDTRRSPDQTSMTAWLRSALHQQYDRVLAETLPDDLRQMIEESTTP